MRYNAQEVAASLRSERARKGWSREELANVSGVAASTLGTYETGKCGVSLENAWKLADALHLSIGHLVGRNEAQYGRTKDEVA